MHRLIALDLPGGPAFVDAVRRAWDDGDAILPIDDRLPAPARAALLDATRPHVVLGPDGTAIATRTDGIPVAADDALVIATSGTTGTPKIVVHTRAGLRAHAAAVGRRLEVDPNSDRWLACLPLAHIGGLGVVLRSIITSTPVDVVPRFAAKQVDDAPALLGSTLVSLVPTALDRVDPARWRCIVLGGSADRGDRPANVVPTYGLTETGGGIVYGDTPLDGVDLRTDPGGAIEVRGPMLARGRRGVDGEVTPIADDEGWFRTGDLGVVHRDPGRPPRLEVLGRSDDLIVTGGQNVWPAPVEVAIGHDPSVAEVAVFGRADPEWGEVVVAAVVPVAGTPGPTLDAIRDRVRATLPTYAAPKVLELVTALPRTTSGKVRRGAL